MKMKFNSIVRPRNKMLQYDKIILISSLFMKIFRLIFAAKFFQYFIKYEFFGNPLKDLKDQLKEENKKSTESFRLLDRQ